MPHIVVSVLQGMTCEKKRDLAEGIAGAVARDVGLPVDMVRREVSFLDVPLENCAPAVGYSEDNLPLGVRYVSMSILRGRPLEQKRCLVRDIALAVAEVLNVPPDTDEIAVEINEVDPANISHGGVLTVDTKEPPLPLE